MPTWGMYRARQAGAGDGLLSARPSVSRPNSVVHNNLGNVLAKEHKAEAEASTRQPFATSQPSPKALQPGNCPGNSGEIWKAASCYHLALRASAQLRAGGFITWDPSMRLRATWTRPRPVTGKRSIASRIMPRRITTWGMSCTNRGNWWKRRSAFGKPCGSGRNLPRPTPTWEMSCEHRGGWRRRQSATGKPSSSSPTTLRRTATWG